MFQKSSRMTIKKSFAFITIFYLSTLPAWRASLATSESESKPVVAAGHTLGQKPLTLFDCFELAKNQNEKIRIQMENVTQAKAREKGAIGSVLPNLHWKNTVTWQDTSGVTISSVADNSLFKKQRTESRFTLTQPVF